MSPIKRPRFGGVFLFALHLLRVQGFCFALLQYRPIQAFTARFVPLMQLYRPRHVRAHTRARTPCTDTSYQTPRRTLYSLAQPPIIIRYIRVQGCAARYGSMPDSAADCRPRQPGGVSASTCTGSARRLAIWHPPLGGAVQQQGHGGRRGTIDGYRRISFRAVAR